MFNIIRNIQRVYIAVRHKRQVTFYVYGTYKDDNSMEIYLQENHKILHYIIIFRSFSDIKKGCMSGFL